MACGMGRHFATSGEPGPHQPNGMSPQDTIAHVSTLVSNMAKEGKENLSKFEIKDKSQNVTYYNQHIQMLESSLTAHSNSFKTLPYIFSADAALKILDLYWEHHKKYTDTIETLDANSKTARGSSQDFDFSQDCSSYITAEYQALRALIPKITKTDFMHFISENEKTLQNEPSEIDDFRYIVQYVVKERMSNTNPASKYGSRDNT